jgi:hypothetical protein
VASIAGMEATTTAEYLGSLEPERRKTLESVHDLVSSAMPEGYQEHIAHGMITWSVPLERFPDTYNGEPLAYAALASQKQYCSLYLMGLYSDPDRERDFRQRWTADGRRLDMGKSCLRFKRLEDLDLDLVRDAISAMPVEEFLDTYERVRAR